MTLKIRPFEPTNSEYETLARILKAADPVHCRTAEELAHFDQGFREGEIFRRFVGELDGQTVAYSNCGQRSGMVKPGKFWLNFGVHPEYDQIDYLAQMHAHLQDVVTALGAKKLASSAKENRPERLTLLEQQGYVCMMRERNSTLQVAQFDPTPFQTAVQRSSQANVTINALPQLQANDPDWLVKLEDLAWHVGNDVPSIDPQDPAGRVSPEAYQERLKRPSALLDAWFIAVDEADGSPTHGQYVGFSLLHRVLDDPKRLDTGMTGVRRSHRRKGIATTLKLRAIEFAQAYGAAVIWTENEENNPMYQINLALGFKPETAWLEYVKEL